VQFKIEQLALKMNPRYEAQAQELLTLLGITDWVEDHVTAQGSVFEFRGTVQQNQAHLRFNYTALDQCRELELLRYEKGHNWLESIPGATVSHLGMHCSEQDLSEWHRALLAIGIVPVQEVWTTEHTNPAIADSRRYHYCIYGTRHLIGTDLKFIVRYEHTGNGE
jgi:hypothetical protein